MSDSITHEWYVITAEDNFKLSSRTGFKHNDIGDGEIGFLETEDLLQIVTLFRRHARPGTHRVRTLDPNVDIIVRIPESSS